MSGLGRCFTSANGLKYSLSLPAIVFTLSALLSGQGSAFEFVDQPISRDLIEGRNTILQCSVSNGTNIQFKWTLDGEDIPDEERRRVIDGNLHITGVDRVSDLGEFYCVATDTSTGESQTSTSAVLNIIWIQPSAKVTLKTPASLDLVEEGSRVTLNCKIDGNPMPEITWYRGKFKLEADSNIELSRNRLKIQSVGTRDSGNYACKGQNRAGQSWSTAGNVTLNVLDADFPFNQLAPEDVVVLLGQTARFQCAFTGNPTPIIEWYFRGSDNSIVHLANGTNTSILVDGSIVINDVKRSDEGSYICMGQSTLGESDVEAKLIVAKVEALPNLGTRILPSGRRLAVNCTYPYGVQGGTPTPVLSWLDQSGNPISSNQEDRLHVEGGTLIVFETVEAEDNGNFTCRAVNIAGEKTTLLGVILATVPVFTLTPMDTSAREGADVWLHCKADANPPPRITWLRDGKDMQGWQGQRFRVLSNGTLHIIQLMLNDANTYSCTAATVAGQETATMELSVIPVLKFSPTPAGKALELGEDSKLVCRATAATIPVIRWFKVGNSKLSPWDSHINETDGKLSFHPARKTDAGEYICVATAGSEMINTTVLIDVFVRPRFSTRPSNTTGYVGYPLTIDCKAEGDPQPHMSWLGMDPGRMTNTNGTLHIDSVLESDAGMYQCIAGSNAGLNSAEISITVKKGNPPGSIAFTPPLMKRTIGIAVGCALAYIILVVGLMWWCRRRRHKQRRLMKELALANEAGPDGVGPQTKLNGTLPHEHPPPTPPAGVAFPVEDVKTGTGAVSNGDIAMNPLLKGARRGSYDKLQFPRHDLQTLVVIGHGSYGEVFLARAAGISEGVEATTVMVKALQNRNEAQQMDFRREMDMLSKLNHDNIVKLLGMCRDGEPQLMITEYLEWGDMKQYLHATCGENGTTNVPPPLTLTQKLDIVGQISLGMEHLSCSRFIHGDLAARNCLLSPAMEAKVTMMAVSRDLYRSEYHEYKQKLVPIRWMPAEAIFEDELSTKSDVWSYGVFIWEVFSQGKLPYGQLNNDDLMRALLDGKLMLETPAAMPEEVEILMHRCWAESAKERYSFSEIAVAVQGITLDSAL